MHTHTHTHTHMIARIISDTVAQMATLTKTKRFSTAREGMILRPGSGDART